MSEEKLLSSFESAKTLGISEATLKNWIKHGYLVPSIKNKLIYFKKNDIKDLFNKIDSGQIERLDKRANKRNAKKTFIPEEYIRDKKNIILIEEIVNKIKIYKISNLEKIFIFSIAFLNQKGFCNIKNIEKIDNINRYKIRRLYYEIKNIHQQLKKIDPGAFKNILSYKLPDEEDALGIIYQSILHEGQKAKLGAYYTPKSIIDSIIKDHLTDGVKALDPCCGTGNFLLKFADVIKDPHLLYGVDVDPVAVYIARINLILKYPGVDFIPKIYCRDFLSDIKKNDFNNFNLICTNPPWGFHFPKDEELILRKKYPEINSGESFSYILNKSISLLKTDGKISFILPESILNVKTHSDIRKIILDGTAIVKIIYMKRFFKNVFTPVIRLDLSKNTTYKQIEIINDITAFKISSERFKSNNNFIFDIHTNEKEEKIIEKVYKLPHTTLKNNARWALGIVTGDNKKFLSNVKKEGYEEIYKGSDVDFFTLKKNKYFIRFKPKDFQQCAPEKLYRVKEKLIYRFISKYPVFAYDGKQSLTLNSANIVVPEIYGYPLKVILALFNSSLYRFIYMKKFSSIKVLKNALEELPLPLIKKENLIFIENCVNDILKGNARTNNLNNYIFNLFEINEIEKKIILSGI